ncbi:MAG TPA: TatD family hydrolase [Candidatus Saccharimonadales bacterium]|nr:TatD family hydrolase [Candidatus Saccharimonadales bacterium]
MLVDTHCHIHEPNYQLNADETIARANAAGVTAMICVGTSETSSKQAVEFAATREGVYAAIGVHPHDTKDNWRGIFGLADTPKVIAVGEIGLDYYYNHSPREIQLKALEEQLDFALKHDLPVIFHVREAFDDFWSVFDNFHGIRGELHSFTDSMAHLEEGLKRGLYIGVNGISTFTKDTKQKEMLASIPLDKMLLETDAPFLTPAPLRGKVNEPAFVRHVAEFHAHARGISLDEIATVTTANARVVFTLS